MELYWYWFIAGAVICLAEFFSRNFYALAIGIGVAEITIIAYLGAPIEAQIGAAVLTATVNVNALQSLLLTISEQKRLRAITGNDAEPGQKVKVIKWNDDDTAVVDYSGIQWPAVLFVKDMPRESFGFVRAVNGDKLIISTIKES